MNAGQQLAMPAAWHSGPQAFTQHSDANGYVAPRWLSGGHWQTLYATALVRAGAPLLERQQWQTGSDVIPVDIGRGDPGRPALVIAHGLKGSARSHYARALAGHFLALGWTVIVPRIARLQDDLLASNVAGSRLGQVIARVASHVRCTHRYAVGVSLGGNLLLRWLAGAEAGLIDAAAVVSVPIDLEGSFRRVSQGPSRLYAWHFHHLRDGDAVARRKSPLPRRPDQWAAGNAHDDLLRIPVRTLIVNARNDPCLTARCFPRPEQVSPSVELEYPDAGGHVGFVTGPFPGRFDWLPARLARFFGQAGGDCA